MLLTPIISGASCQGVHVRNQPPNSGHTSDRLISLDQSHAGTLFSVAGSFVVCLANRNMRYRLISSAPRAASVRDRDADIFRTAASLSRRRLHPAALASEPSPQHRRLLQLRPTSL